MADTQVVLDKGQSPPTLPPPPEEETARANPAPARRPYGRRGSRITLRTIALVYVALLVRFFGGMEISDIAEVLQINARTVDRDWQFAKAWLHRELGGQHDALSVHPGSV